MCVCLYLCVQPQHDDHDEEAGGPELGYRHHGYSSREDNEGKAWPCENTPPPPPQDKYDEHTCYSKLKCGVDFMGSDPAHPILITLYKKAKYNHYVRP